MVDAAGPISVPAGPSAALRPSLAIDYCNSAEDLIEVYAITNRYYRWLRRVPSMMIGVLLLLLLDNFVEGKTPNSTVLIPVFGVSLLGSILRDSEERRLRWVFRVTVEDSPRRVVVTPEGIQTGTSPEIVFWNWGQIEQIASSDHSLYFSCRKPEGYELFMIPRRSFRTPQAADDFLMLARTYQACAQSTEG